MSVAMLWLMCTGAAGGQPSAPPSTASISTVVSEDVKRAVVTVIAIGEQGRICQNGIASDEEQLRDIRARQTATRIQATVFAKERADAAAARDSASRANDREKYASAVRSIDGATRKLNELEASQTRLIAEERAKATHLAGQQKCLTDIERRLAALASSNLQR